MFHLLLVYLGSLIAIAGLLLAFFAQRYWFARVWTFAGRIHHPAARKASRGALLGLLMAIGVVALIDVVTNIRGTVSRGSWWTAFFGFWLSSSILSYLLIKMIAGADWLWRRLRSAFSERPRVLPAPPAPAGGSTRSDGVNYSRRQFFHAAGFLVGAVPFVSFAYGFVSERFRFEVREIEIPIANLPPALDGMRITQLSDIHIGSYMPISEVRRAVGMANELGGDLTVVTGDFLTIRGPILSRIALRNFRGCALRWACGDATETTRSMRMPKPRPPACFTGSACACFARKMPNCAGREARSI